MREADLEGVRDILGCITAIELAEVAVRRREGDHEIARLALDAVRYRLIAIGQAVESLSLDLREDHPVVPWPDMARLIELIGDDREELDAQVVRATIGEPVSRLRAACRAILGESVRFGEDEP